MFEVLMPYRQDSATLMAQQIAGGVFPQALLITGHRYSGRFRLAMEAARALSCREGGQAACGCQSCRAFSSYGMSNVVYVGNRNHMSRIEAALAIMEDSGSESNRTFLIQTVRMMLLQFHPALLDGKDTKSSSNFEAASTVSEVLFDLEEAREDQLSELVQKLRTTLKPLYNHVRKSSALGIGQVRSIQEWTVQTSFSDQPRFIVLEGVEESTEGARNSLLKLLEEPPRQTYIMILSENPSRLLPTILSRLQRHHVRPLDSQTKNRVLSDLFSTNGDDYQSVEQFMLEKASVPCKELENLAQRYADSVLDHTPFDRSELDSLCSELDEPVRLEYFLTQFQEAVRARFLGGNCSTSVVSTLLEISGSFAQKAFIFNQNGKVLVESLYYRLREVV